MARSVARISAEERRRQILAVATTLFARQGFQGTKTREIATKAHVNEAILFRHFPTKNVLYWAVLDEKCRARRGLAELESLLLSGRAVRDVFTGIAEGLLRRNMQDPSILRLWLFSGLENHRLYRRFYRTYVAAYYEVLAGYIRLQIRAGRFHRVDPYLAARGFLGMIVQYLISENIFAGTPRANHTPGHVSRALSEIWLAGMQGRVGPRARRATRAPRPRAKTVAVRIGVRKP